MAYSNEEARIKIIKACHQLVSSGLIARTWGNVSARLDENTFVITPSGKSYENLRPDDLVEVSINNLETIGEGTPSSEKGVHGISYFLRPDINFIIHTHQQYASCLSIACDNISDKFPLAKYGLNGSQSLINSVGHVIRKHKGENAFLMANHGAICLGKTDEESFLNAYDLESRCRKEYITLCQNNNKEFYDNVDALTDFTEGIGISKSNYIEILDASRITFLLTSPYAVQISKLGKDILPYIDDFAQFGGISMRTIDFIEQLDSALLSDITSFNIKKEPSFESSQPSIHRQCAILKNKGIICHSSYEDLYDLSLVVEKQCQAAYLANIIGNISPIAQENVRIDRENYILSYSKLK